MPTDLPPRPPATAASTLAPATLEALGIAGMFFSTPEAAVVSDAATGRIWHWNGRAEALFGYPAADVVGRPLSGLVSETAAGPVGQRHDGRQLPLALTRVPLTGFGAGTFELALLRPDGEAVALRDERDRLAAELASLASRAGELEQQLLSHLSHELRTPINAIMGFGSMLDEGLAGPLTDEQRGYTERIMRGADSLVGMVDEMLDWGLMRSGRLAVSPGAADIPALARRVLAELAPAAARRQHRLVDELPASLPLVAGEGRRLAQVLSQLVGNAIKYTPEGGTIRVRAFIRDGRTRVEVEDTGPGIAIEDRPHLFARALGADAAHARAVGSAGLGLPLAKAIVEAHGGRIGVTSTAGQGSTFWFVLPPGGPPEA